MVMQKIIVKNILFFCSRVRHKVISFAANIIGYGFYLAIIDIKWKCILQLPYFILSKKQEFGKAAPQARCCTKSASLSANTIKFHFWYQHNVSRNL